MVKADKKNKAAAKAWRLYRASLKSKSTKATSKVKLTTHVKKAWGTGRLIHAGRIIDVVSRPFQAGAIVHGFTKEGLKLSAELYTVGVSEGKFRKEILESYKGMAVGLGNNYLKSRMGVYKGVGQGKIISGVQALLPEILALQDFDPSKDIKGYNWARIIYDSGLNTVKNTTNYNARSYEGSRFWQEKGINLALGAIQKIVFNTNGWLKLNKILPKYVNG